ncbi:DeoR/GlpR family DNA-binding transcription regulator [bacterium]|nr:DeoR/GlpR family DNA-binding transcription regulator [bacterium]
MNAEVRQKKIEYHLKKVEFASLDELAVMFDASVSTVRRDVTQLETKGLAKRTHGGVRLMKPSSDEFAFTSRDTHQLIEKEMIGRTAAKLIEPNQTVILDAGTTVFHVAKYLESKTPHIITNSLPVANHYASNHLIEVVLTGGVIYPRLGVLVGPLAVESFSRMQADIAIMSAGGITLDGISNSHVLLIEIQQAMMRAAEKVIICIDHTKFGRKSLTRLCGLGQIDMLVTNERAPMEMIKEMEKTGLEVHLAKS